MCVKAEIQVKLKGQPNITVNLDGWTENRGHSVYTCNIVFPDRQIAQWACEDVLPESHTGEIPAGLGSDNPMPWQVKALHSLQTLVTAVCSVTVCTC